MLTSVDLAKYLRPGMHAATFGGNPLAAVAGIAAIEMIEKDNLLSHVETIAKIFQEQLSHLKDECDVIVSVRVLGMMIGIELSIDGTAVVQACMERKLLVNCTQGRVIRLLPAMTLSPDEARDGCNRLRDAITEVASRY